jgi:hypothetical protein
MGGVGGFCVLQLARGVAVHGAVSIVGCYATVETSECRLVTATIENTARHLLIRQSVCGAWDPGYEHAGNF